MSIEHLFDSYAETYDEKFNKNPIAKYQRERVQQEVAPYLHSVGRILDVGCGPGSDFDFYKPFDIVVDAIDISPKMVELAREKANRIHLNANIRVSSLEEFQSPEKYPVIILNFGVMNAIGNPDAAFEQLNRLLETDGILVIVSMPPFHFFSIKGLAVGLHFKQIANRLLKRRTVLKSGFTIYYYNQKDFTRHFDILKKINLCALLPTPDQYSRWKWLQWYSKIMIPLDREIAAVLPDFFGGDHICYILRRK